MFANVSQLAEILKVSRPTIYDYKKQGMPVEQNGKFDVKLCVEWAAGHSTSVVKPGPALGSENGNKTSDNDWRLEMQRLRLREQRATTEAAEYRAKIKRGDLISSQAACLIHSRILWNLYRTLDMLPLKFLQYISKDRDMVVQVDSIVRGNVWSAFHSAISDSDIRKQNAYILRKSEILAKLCRTEIELLKHEGRDPDTAESFLKFAEEIRALFFEMKPELVEKLGLRLHTRESILEGNNE